jgi:hypothetical protein
MKAKALLSVGRLSRLGMTKEAEKAVFKIGECIVYGDGS